MEHLDKAQYTFLLNLSKSGEKKYDSLSKDEIQIAHYLESKHLANINRHTIPRFNSSTGKVENHYGKAYSVSISEGGKAYFSERKYLIREKWIPYIITTGISILALMKSYGFGIDDIVIWCMQRLTK